VTRTLSKAYGLAGLRVGYALGPKPLITPLRVVGQPYPVSGLSLALAMNALTGDAADRTKAIDRVRSERTTLAEELATRGVWCVASQANFVLARFGEAAMQVRERMAARGIAVRAFGDDPTLSGCVRITCPGSVRDFERLIEAIREVVGT
jgi:histidinol-phosphate aminotransferase